MMEKFVRYILIGFIMSVITLVGAGWKARGEIQSEAARIKNEVKAEMVEIRNRDMHYIEARMNGLEIILAGRVVNKVELPTADTHK